MLETQLDKKALENANELEQNNSDNNNNNGNNINNNSNNNNNIQQTQTVDTAEELKSTSDDTPPEPNCLALTVRKDYSLTVIKNIFTTSGRMSLKIALSTLALNFLRIFF